ncbi:MAG: hypothetical protein ACRDRV_19290 [Pseudonocardiaceae bacterium]
MDRSLRRAVLERLAAVEEMAVRTGSHLTVRVARTHLKTITGGWRELLLEHQPDLKGRCPVCSGWLRRRRWPCQVWVTAHRHLIGDGPEPGRWSAEKSNPFRRPRRVEVIPRQTGAADQSRADQSRADQTRAVATPRPAADPRPAAAGPAGTGPRPAEQFAVNPPEFAGHRPTADGVEIHRAPITEREPVLPRSRRSWRART